MYSSLQATYACKDGPILTLGSAYERKTIGYSSRFLAYGTLLSPDQRCDENVVVGGFHTIDFSDLYYHPITTSLTSKAGCPPYVNPRLSMPADLTDVDPAWATCQPLYYGAFDPPRVLTRVNGPMIPLSAPSKPTSVPVPAHDPILTKPQGITPASTSATQGAEVPAIPSATSMAPPPSLAKQAAASSTEGRDPAGSDPPSPPAAINLSQSAAHTTSDLPVTSQPSEDSPGGSPSQGLPPVPVADAPNLPQSRPSPTSKIALAPHLSIDAPLSASYSRISKPSPTRVVPVVAIPSFIASPPQGTDPVAVLPKGWIPQINNPQEMQSQLSTAGSGKIQPENSQDGQVIGPISAAISAPILVPLPNSQPANAFGSGGNDPGGDGNSTLTPPTSQTGVTSEIGSPDQGHGERSTKSQIESLAPGLASPILVGLSGSAPPDEGPAPGNVEGIEQVSRSVGASPVSRSLHLAVLETPKPLAIGTYAVGRAAHGGIIVASRTIQPGQQITVEGTPVSVGTKKLVIGDTTHAFIPQGQPSADSTVFSSTMQEHTLAAGAVTTINGFPTTNTGLSAVTFSAPPRIAISTAIAASAPVEDQPQDAESVIYSTSVQEHTLQPGHITTIGNSITTNLASTPVVISQITSTPISTIDSPPPPLLSTLYSLSLFTTAISPGSAFTVSGSLTTNIASGPLTLAQETQIPVSTATLSPSWTSSPNQIFEINDRLVTQTLGVYGLNEVTTASGDLGEHVTLGYVDGKDGSTLTKVVTLPAELTSQLIARPESGSLRNETTVKPLPTSALISNSAGDPRLTTLQASDIQTWLPVSEANMKNVDDRLVKILTLLAGCICVFTFRW